ncbi:MAG: rhodanese-like domain-containing protein [Alphaproteobacteria bacterium]|jgi:thiosulfate/3-mercaptopyruvate sulfurtransferase|nr:rhodanese-like domain-containing protein [Alphaproteobacteria bacterium]MDP6817746.1 rhodanese-like domain-containing protein [Alphaproteobacteria bacterium]
MPFFAPNPFRLSRIAALLIVACFAAPAHAAAGAGPLVDAAWAVAHIGRDDVRFLDIRGGGAEDFAAAHIPGAVFSDYFRAGWRTAGADGTPGMLPPVADLEILVGGLGIANTSHIVIVARGLSAGEMAGAARVFWTFKVLGHDAVSILDGGMTAYMALPSAPLESGPATSGRQVFKASFRPELIATKRQVIASQESGAVLLDLRPKNQYSGARGPGFVRRLGTIEGARNLPLNRLTEGGAFKTPAALAELFAAADAAAEGPITCFCNSGHMAALGWFVAHELLGNTEARLYDGSMAEWSADPALAVVPGERRD